MRSGLTFSVVSATGSPARSSSMSDMSRSSPGLASAAFLGLRPRLAPVLAGAPACATAALGGRPGFFFTTSSAAATALAGFFTSSLAVALSDGLAGDFVRGTGFTFVAGLAAALACGLGGVLTTLSLALAGSAGFDHFFGDGFRGGLHELSGLLSGHEKYLGTSKKQKHKKRHYNPARAEENARAPRQGFCRSFRGKMGGRTFGVQSLRGVGRSGACVRGWPGPEVLLSLLPLANPTLYRLSAIFKRLDRLAGSAGPCWRRLSSHQPLDAGRVALRQLGWHCDFFGDQRPGGVRSIARCRSRSPVSSHPRAARPTAACCRSSIKPAQPGLRMAGPPMPSCRAAQGWPPCSWKLAVEPGEQIAQRCLQLAQQCRGPRR